MPQLYAQTASRPDPWLVGRTSAGLCTLQTACPLTITYSGGSPAADIVAAGSAATVYGGSAAAFDASADVWVVLTVPGSGALQVTKEADLAAVTGDWAGLARLVQHAVEPYQPDAFLSAGALGLSGVGGEQSFALTIASTNAVGGSVTTPVLSTSTDYVVTVHLAGSDAAAVWAVLSDQTGASDLKVLFVAAEIDADIDQSTWGPWSSGTIAFSFKLQQPIAAGGTDTAYTCRVGGGARSGAPRERGNIYPLHDDFSGTSLDSSLWTQHMLGGGSAAVSGGLLTLTAGGGADADNYVDSVPTFGVGYAVLASTQMQGHGGTVGDNKVLAGWHGASPYIAIDASDNQGGVGPYNGLAVFHNLWALDSTYQVYGIAWTDSSTYWAWKDGAGPTSFGDWTAGGAMPVMLNAYGHGFADSFAWVKVRPFTAPEPTVAAGGLSGASTGEGDLLYLHGGQWQRLPLGPAGDVLAVVSGDPAWATPGSGGGGGIGTVTSVALAGPTGTTVGGSPITASGTLSLSWSSQSAGTFLGAPSGGSGAPTFRALVAGDIPSLPASQIGSGQLAAARGGTGTDGSSAASGTLLIGNGSGYTLATLTAGSNVTITNGAGSVTIASSGGTSSPLSTKGDLWGYSSADARVPVGSNTQVLTADSTQTLGVKWATPTTGTVTSVALSVPAILSVSGSPISTSGTFSVTLANENQGTVFAGPASGAAAAPTFRVLQGSDLPAAASAGGHIHAHGHFL